MDLLSSHIRGKRTSCNLTAEKYQHETTSNEIHGSYVFIDDIYLALSSNDVDLLDSHIRDKGTSCNLTADKHEIMSKEIHGSHVFIDNNHLALSDILQLI